MWQLHAHYVNCVQYIGAHWAVHIRPVGRNCACDFTCVCIKNELVTHFSTQVFFVCNSNFSKDAKKNNASECSTHTAQQYFELYRLRLLI